jgi:hypothetical protein
LVSVGNCRDNAPADRSDRNYNGLRERTELNKPEEPPFDLST